MRLELRIVPQSGVPGPSSCVYHDPPAAAGAPSPPTRAWVSPGFAKRFEVQYRLTDLDPADGRTPAGLADLTFSIVAPSSSAGLWGRGLLSVSEGEPASAPGGPAAAAIDCSGLPALPTLRKRGLHRPFRTLLSGLGAPLGDPSEDPDNGVFRPDGLLTIHAAPAASPAHPPGAWFGLYTFEFTPGPSFAGPLNITAASTAGGAGGMGGAGFRWFDGTGAAQTVTPAAHPPATAAITLDGPAPPGACCDALRCVILASPSACFATGGFLAAGNVCGPAPPTACCFADFNRDGAVGIQDVLDFVTAYLAGSAAADVNGSGSVTIQDVFDFLRVYFLGCG